MSFMSNHVESSQIVHIVCHWDFPSQHSVKSGEIGGRGSQMFLPRPPATGLLSDQRKNVILGPSRDVS
jgi:hypothetical protein